MDINIIKRDNTKEPFEQDKIARVVKAAGLTDEQAKVLASDVATILETEGKQEVSSLHIRDLVSLELKKVDEYASGMFDWYQNLKEKTIR